MLSFCREFAHSGVHSNKKEHNMLLYTTCSVPRVDVQALTQKSTLSHDYIEMLQYRGIFWLSFKI